jgi:hypothetical protein
MSGFQYVYPAVLSGVDKRELDRFFLTDGSNVMLARAELEQMFNSIFAIYNSFLFME